MVSKGLASDAFAFAIAAGNAQLKPMASYTQAFPVEDYDLRMTLSSGQSFRWNLKDGAWEGVIGNRWVRLRADEFSIQAEVAEPVIDWSWLTEYLQLHVDIREVIRTFPEDRPMTDATTACRGLRLLRQDPWECLASFILSSTKQIVQIKQIIELLTQRFGDALPALPGHGPVFAFPSPVRLARASEKELRACKMGFRAPNLLKTARNVADGEIDLEQLRHVGVEQARVQLLDLAGVGRKIADCVLLFAYGYQSAFPVDVWVMKALRQLYFPRRRVNVKRLHRFAAEHFGPFSGYAQQYLFHYARTIIGREGSGSSKPITSARR
jgi:N-glycosylase/DNA lyase